MRRERTSGMRDQGRSRPCRRLPRLPTAVRRAGRPRRQGAGPDVLSRRPCLEALEARLLLSTTYTVASLADAVAADGFVTLREAIQAANTDTAVNEAPAGSGADTITFAPSLFAGGPGTITLGGTELALSSNLTITGPGATQLTVNANNASRIFNVASGTVSISGLTITGGVGSWTCSAAGSSISTSVRARL